VPVLAARSSDTISLSELGITLQVVSVVGDGVRIVLHVPDNVDHQLNSFEKNAVGTTRFLRTLSRQEFHDLKNHLHAIRLTLHVLRRQELAHKRDAAATTMNRVYSQVNALRELMAPLHDRLGSEKLLPVDSRSARERHLNQ
jgi:hypothetical protein